MHSHSGVVFHVCSMDAPYLRHQPFKQWVPTNGFFELFQPIHQTSVLRNCGVGCGQQRGQHYKETFQQPFPLEHVSITMADYWSDYAKLQNAGYSWPMLFDERIAVANFMLDSSQKHFLQYISIYCLFDIFLLLSKLIINMIESSDNLLKFLLILVNFR